MWLQYTAPSLRLRKTRFYGGETFLPSHVCTARGQRNLSHCPALPSSCRFPIPSDIGTARAQWADEKNYSRGEDICRGNVVSNNEIETNVRTIRDAPACRTKLAFLAGVCAVVHQTWQSNMNIDGKDTANNQPRIVSLLRP